MRIDLWNNWDFDRGDWDFTLFAISYINVDGFKCFGIQIFNFIIDFEWGKQE